MLYGAFVFDRNCASSGSEKEQPSLYTYQYDFYTSQKYAPNARQAEPLGKRLHDDEVFVPLV
jgi:hypothetical protein